MLRLWALLGLLAGMLDPLCWVSFFFYIQYVYCFYVYYITKINALFMRNRRSWKVFRDEFYAMFEELYSKHKKLTERVSRNEAHSRYLNLRVYGIEGAPKENLEIIFKRIARRVWAQSTIH